MAWDMQQGKLGNASKRKNNYFDMVLAAVLLICLVGLIIVLSRGAPVQKITPENPKTDRMPQEKKLVQPGL